MGVVDGWVDGGRVVGLGRWVGGGRRGETEVC